MIDFRSDTVTRPDAAMREAMATAVVGDDVLGDDPTVQELEAEFAKVVGKEKALYVPSGTMGNVIAVLVHARPGDELVMEERTHTFQYEGGAACRFGGVSIRTFQNPSGIPDIEDVDRCLRNPDDIHQPRSSLFVLENTHNMAGGRIVPLARVEELSEFVHGKGLRVHMDGARLFNASVASGHSPAKIATSVDSVQTCLSKGLGAPVGSMIAGTAEFVQEGRRVRKALGGGMRQAGVIAAAGLLALRDGPARLAADHQHAQRLALALATIPGFEIDLQAVDTNIIMVDLEGWDGRSLVATADQAGVAFFAITPKRLRFVLHRDVSTEQVDEAIGILQQLYGKGPDELGRPVGYDSEAWNS
jgi:threonine aldolase